MKKITYSLAIILSLVLADISQGATTSFLNSNGETITTKLEGGGRKNKNGQYRKKKGFLWGLFKGKNACDCPKH